MMLVMGLVGGVPSAKGDQVLEKAAFLQSPVSHFKSG